jgi:hypothetical protein
VEEQKAGAVVALPARETRPVRECGPGAGELVGRHRHGGGGITAHPVGSVSGERCGVAHRGVQGVGL